MDCQLESRRSFHFERSACSKAILTTRRPIGRRGVDVLAQPKLVEVLDTRRTFAVEFSKTGAALTAQKRPPTRARRPPRKRIVAYTSRCREAPMVELQGFPAHARSDGLRSIAVGTRVSNVRSAVFRPAGAL